jgi:hypothetical protein
MFLVLELVEYRMVFKLTNKESHGTFKTIAIVTEKILDDERTEAAL